MGSLLSVVNWNQENPTYSKLPLSGERLQIRSNVNMSKWGLGGCVQ